MDPNCSINQQQLEESIHSSLQSIGAEIALDNSSPAIEVTAESFEQHAKSLLSESFAEKPQKKTRRTHTRYADEDRATIAKYAIEHGNAAAIKRFKDVYTLPESTVRTFRKRYLEELARKQQSSGGEEALSAEITSVKNKKRGRRKSMELLQAVKLAAARSAAAADGNIESLDILGLPKYSSPQVKPKIQIETAPFELSFPAPASPISHVENHTPPQKRVHRDEGTRTDEMLTKILSEVNNKKESPEAVDEEGLFGLQVAATLRRLSSRQKAMAKMKIQQVMLEIEFPADS